MELDSDIVIIAVMCSVFPTQSQRDHIKGLLLYFPCFSQFFKHPFVWENIPLKLHELTCNTVDAP
jgi:hypothetical protein